METVIIIPLAEPVTGCSVARDIAQFAKTKLWLGGRSDHADSASHRRGLGVDNGQHVASEGGTSIMHDQQFTISKSLRAKIRHSLSEQATAARLGNCYAGNHQAGLSSTNGKYHRVGLLYFDLSCRSCA